ncbi:MAG: aspartate dehydrogenase [Burkholderiaceae bacterium]|jgi:aspartate dehydrogenase
MRRPHIALLGYGAIGRAILQAYPLDPAAPWLQTLVVRPGQEEAVRNQVDPIIAVTAEVPETTTLLLECAGHEAVASHVLPALARGTRVGMVSTGALSDHVLLAELDSAAHRGQTQLHLLSGALGGIDALSAARGAGLEAVVYTGRKPPKAWIGTPAEHERDLGALSAPQVIFAGSAREACRRYPKNANVAATIALAGLGLDRTEVRLVADPTIDRNGHSFEARGVFGAMQVHLQVQPLVSNPKTSALTVWSAVRFLRSQQAGIIV